MRVGEGSLSHFYLAFQFVSADKSSDSKKNCTFIVDSVMTVFPCCLAKVYQYVILMQLYKANKHNSRYAFIEVLSSIVLFFRKSNDGEKKSSTFMLSLKAFNNISTNETINKSIGHSQTLDQRKTTLSIYIKLPNFYLVDCTES